MKTTTALLFLFVLGCSSSHQISINVAQTNPISREHRTIAIVIPDSLRAQVVTAAISGGCEGHEFQLYTGNGLASALSEATKQYYDSVLVLGSIPTADQIRSGHIASILRAEPSEINAHADFAIGTFTVTITGSFVETIDLTIRSASSSSLNVQRIVCTGKSSGTGDCHDGAVFLKKAGTSAMTMLRDSVAIILRSLRDQ